MSDDVPIIVGNAGLVGRQQIVRIPEADVDEDGNAIPILTAPGTAMPGNCRRVQSSPLPVDRGGGCPPDCAGRQRSGGCLLDVVAAAYAAGIKDWQFEIDPVNGFWDYCGPEIPGFEPSALPSAPAEAVPPSFECPHCGAHVDQTYANYHFWCPACGRNAKEE